MNFRDATVFRAHAVPQGECDNLINALKLLTNRQKDGDSPVKMVGGEVGEEVVVWLCVWVVGCGWWVVDWVLCAVCCVLCAVCCLLCAVLCRPVPCRAVPCSGGGGGGVCGEGERESGGVGVGVGVVVVVVVVLTVCLDDVSVHATKRDHVPVDVTHLALHLCAGP